MADLVTHAQRVRLAEILRRHIQAEDAPRSDHDFVQKVFERYAASRAQPLIDPNE